MPEFATTFKNLFRRPYIVYENGRQLEIVPSGGELTIISESPMTTFARFDSITISEQGVVECHERHNWNELDYGPYPIELLNSDGSELEVRTVDGQPVFLPRGVSIRVGVSLSDPLIWYSKLEIKRISERKKDPRFEGYWVRELNLRDIKAERSERELRVIEEEMAKTADFVPPEREVQPSNDEPVFECLFVNERSADKVDKDNHPLYNDVKVFSDSGHQFFILKPGEQIIVESFDAKVLYSRFSKVVFKADGSVKVEENKRWRNPYPGLSIELCNYADVPVQAISLHDGNRAVDRKAIRNFPQFFPIAVVDPNAIFKRIVWKKIKTRRKNPVFEGYFVEQEELVVEKELRSEKEVKAIEEERARLIDDDAQQRKNLHQQMFERESRAFSKEVFGSEK